ncbi:hypothetical protein GGI21_000756 [Coemansia aciculifera]|uniref:Uncharacterized protein n=1 Tax=Coemansia aciculifera TaxID=417176 RepID=A0ACC1M912_9FUNG|nr:hypothetical protein IWW38_000873 [Coemansia aciculifera]KAJ2910555.1 hypothetical protein GGI21_000756 [Coemansia aciculifera]
MKTSITVFGLLAASLAAAAPGYHTDMHHSHDLRTFTDDQGYTLLIDEANNELGGFIAGISGVDGIYNVKDEQPESGTDTWVDVHNGNYAVIDYEQPRYYTVYNSAGSPIATHSHAMPTAMPSGGYSSAPEHYLMTFVNQDSETLLIDQAVTNAAILEVGIEGVDGIYTVPKGGFPTGKETGTDTWVDSVDGIVAVIDNANPNLYTVYDSASNPIETVSIPTTMPTPTKHHSHDLRTFTDDQGYTLLIDEANHELGGFIAGISGVDGIYNVNDEQPQSGTDTWVDVHDGNYAVIDYEQPRYYTVYNSAGSPIATHSHAMPTAMPSGGYSSAPEHYLMTFVNQDSETLLIDQAVTNAAILEVGIEGVDGIYTVPKGGFPTGKETGTDTWVDSVDGIVAVIDNANPNVYTVYDTASNPIETISY